MLQLLSFLVPLLNSLYESVRASRSYILLLVVKLFKALLRAFQVVDHQGSGSTPRTSTMSKRYSSSSLPNGSKSFLPVRISNIVQPRAHKSEPGPTCLSRINSGARYGPGVPRSFGGLAASKASGNVLIVLGSPMPTDGPEGKSLGPKLRMETRVMGMARATMKMRRLRRESLHSCRKEPVPSVIKTKILHRRLRTRSWPSLEFLEAL